MDSSGHRQSDVAIFNPVAVAKQYLYSEGRVSHSEYFARNAKA